MNHNKGSEKNRNYNTSSVKPVLSEQELELIRQTAQLTENLYVKMVYDKLATEKILKLL
ncbi:hypothetical protein D3C83_155650 [compost metagenome]